MDGGEQVLGETTRGEGDAVCAQIAESVDHIR